MAVGDLLRSHDDRWVPVESIADAAACPVYNVCVEGNGTYFVGDRDWGFSVWVYGGCNRRDTVVKEAVSQNPLRPPSRKVETAFGQVVLEMPDNDGIPQP